MDARSYIVFFLSGYEAMPFVTVIYLCVFYFIVNAILRGFLLLFSDYHDQADFPFCNLTLSEFFFLGYQVVCLLSCIFYDDDLIAYFATYCFILLPVSCTLFMLWDFFEYTHLPSCSVTMATR